MFEKVSFLNLVIKFELQPEFLPPIQFKKIEPNLFNCFLFIISTNFQQQVCQDFHWTIEYENDYLRSEDVS